MPKPANLQPAISDQDGLTPEQLAEVWARRADALAQKPPEEISGDTITLLVFWMGQEQYGVDVINVREIYPLEQLTPVPRTPDFVVGVFSARGRILSVIDLRAFYGLPVTLPVNAEAREGSQSKIIVVTNTDPTSDTADMEIGLLADEVTDVRVIFMDQLEPPLSVQTGGRANHIQGLTADMLVVLDLNALLNDKQLIVKDEL
jgi:purine-binding chemotaxis protein CheW